MIYVKWKKKSQSSEVSKLDTIIFKYNLKYINLMYCLWKLILFFLNRSWFFSLETSISWAFPANLSPQLSFQRRTKFPMASFSFCYTASWSRRSWNSNETGPKEICLSSFCYGGMNTSAWLLIHWSYKSYDDSI